MDMILKTNDVVPTYAIVVGIVITLVLIITLIILYLIFPRKRHHL